MLQHHSTWAMFGFCRPFCVSLVSFWFLVGRSEKGQYVQNDTLDVTSRRYAIERTIAAFFEDCTFEIAGFQADYEPLDQCLGHARELLGIESGQELTTFTCIGLVRGLGSQIDYLNGSRKVCSHTPGLNMTTRACDGLLLMAWELMAMALKSLTLCSVGQEVLDSSAIDIFARETFAQAVRQLEVEIDAHTGSPLGCLLVEKLVELRNNFDHPLATPADPSLDLTSVPRQVTSRMLALTRGLGQYANWLVWRDTHFSWLSDSLRQEQVVHTAWGPPEHWEELGAGDVRAIHQLQSARRHPPRFSFSTETGQRRDILESLLKRLHEDRGAGEHGLVLVEVGVFRADLSEFLLNKLPFLRLIGVDPYIGVDGTFPGDFSVTLPAEVAKEAAMEKLGRFVGRGSLIAKKSLQAAEIIPDSSIDAVFIDGCHLYECVEEDLRTWLPKLRGRGALVAGHDFSPQWGGVVRAVVEQRSGGQPVMLGNDWMFWWYTE